MNTSLLREAFRRLKGLPFAGSGEIGPADQCEPCIEQAMDLLIDETEPRIRLIPGYEERLRAPIVAAFGYIGSMVDLLPAALRCSRSTYVSDARTNAFFANPEQMCEVFSSSREVRELFNAMPMAAECWGLLCMRMNESRRLGVALDGDQIRRDVLQTHISFSDHQVMSPGHSEDDAREALKCCIFKNLAVFVQRQMTKAKRAQLAHDTRRRVLDGRIRSAHDEAERTRLQAELEELDRQPGRGTRFGTLDDYLDFVESTLRNTEEFVACRNREVRVSRLGVQISNDDPEQGLAFPVTEISVASHAPRIAALACFPRGELLPGRDIVKEANLFFAG